MSRMEPHVVRPILRLSVGKQALSIRRGGSPVFRRMHTLILIFVFFFVVCKKQNFEASWALKLFAAPKKRSLDSTKMYVSCCAVSFGLSIPLLLRGVLLCSQALRVLSWLKSRRNCRANVNSYTPVVEALTRELRWQEAILLFQEMEERKITPTVQSYTSVVRA